MGRELDDMLGRTVAVRAGRYATVGRLSLQAMSGMIFYAVAAQRFSEEAVKDVKRSAVLPVVVLR